MSDCFWASLIFLAVIAALFALTRHLSNGYCVQDDLADHEKG
jgi:hypothetical protein